jgi:carotenoid cleavage dioxygenase-like enzyme
MFTLRRRDALLGGAGLLAAVLAPEGLQAAVAAETAARWDIAFGDLDADLPPRPMRLVQGRAPKDLNGVLLRNGGARFRRPKGAATHWFDGDGLIRRFALRDGAAVLDARFVDTQKRRNDAAANAVVSRGFGTPSGPDVAMASPDDVNAANISVIRRGDALWALWEAGSPVALDPETLKTRGLVTLRDDLAHMPFLAHPRFEPDGSLWNLGQAGQSAVVWRVDPKGALMAAPPVALPRASYIHDFTMTAKSLVIVLQPWIYEDDDVATSALKWRPKDGVEVLVLDKDDLSRQRRFTLPTFFHFHMGGAVEDAAGAIRFEICQAPDPTFAVQGAVDVLKGVYRPEAAPTLAFVTLGRDGRASLDITGVAGEFPRADQRFSGRARDYTLHAALKSADRPLFQGVGLYDWKHQKSTVFDLGAHRLVEEMVFTPRPGSSSEMDGYVIGPVVNLKEKATELLVFDAKRIGDGPVCTWRADIAIPAGLHGYFTPA